MEQALYLKYHNRSRNDRLLSEAEHLFRQHRDFVDKLQVAETVSAQNRQTRIQTTHATSEDLKGHLAVQRAETKESRIMGPLRFIRSTKVAKLVLRDAPVATPDDASNLPTEESDFITLERAYDDLHQNLRLGKMFMSINPDIVELAANMAPSYSYDKDQHTKV